MGKRELVALLSLSNRCLVTVVWLFLAVPWVCLQFVIVAFPDHTHYCLVHDHMSMKFEITIVGISTFISMISNQSVSKQGNL